MNSVRLDRTEYLPNDKGVAGPRLLLGTANERVLPAAYDVITTATMHGQRVGPAEAWLLDDQQSRPTGAIRRRPETRHERLRNPFSWGSRE
jgi:hypothetical protein